MRTIVAPTDFSASSLNAVDYAAQLAAATGSSLALLHICVLPITIGDAIPMIPIGELYADAEIEMEKLKMNIEANADRKLEIQTEIRQGGVMPEIYDYCHSVNPWLVVMGAEKAHAFERLVLGGRTTDAVKNLSWPLIIVPQDARFNTIRRIGLACDLKDVEETIPVKQIEALVNEFKSELYILHVNTIPGERFTDENVEQTQSLHNLIKHLNPQYKFINDLHIEIGIDEFAQQHHVDLLIVIPKKHSFLYRVFHSSESKKIVLTSHVPLVAIHE